MAANSAVRQDPETRLRLARRRAQQAERDLEREFLRAYRLLKELRQLNSGGRS